VLFRRRDLEEWTDRAEPPGCGGGDRRCGSARVRLAGGSPGRVWAGKGAGVQPLPADRSPG